MARWDRRYALVFAVSLAVVAGLGAGLASEVGRPYPGFFFAIDYHVVPVEPEARAAGLRWGDRIVAVDGQSPLTLMARVRSATGPVHYGVARADRRLTVDLASQPFTWATLLGHFGGYFVISALMLAVGAAVYLQNPLAAPNRRFLLYMCLWAVSNATLSPHKYGAGLVGFVATLLSIHGWVLFLTYPVNPAREAWLERHRLIPNLYRAAVAVGLALTVTFSVFYQFAPQRLADGWLYPAALAFQLTLAAVSFPIKIAALLDTRRRAVSPLVNQQTGVLLLGIGLGLGCWLTLMLGPLSFVYEGPVDPQVGSALVLLYPAAIAYATVRYRLFDATVVVRRSVIYTGLAGLITGA